MRSNLLFYSICLSLIYIMTATVSDPHEFINQTFSLTDTHSEPFSNNQKCADIDTYDSELVNNNLKFRFLDTKTIVIDLGCNKTISTIDITWKNPNLVVYNYTVTILKDDQTIAKNFSFTSDILPDNTIQSAGTKNTIGEKIKLTINTPINQNISDVIERITIHTPILSQQATDNNSSQWGDINRSFPSSIAIGNSKESIQAPIFRITDGDYIDSINPVYNSNKVFNLTKHSTFYVLNPFEHVEGITVKTSSIKSPVNLKSLNDTIDWDRISSGDKLYFMLETDTMNELDNLQNLTIILAPSSETSVYYKSLIRLLE